MTQEYLAGGGPLHEVESRVEDVGLNFQRADEGPLGLFTTRGG